MPVAAFFADIFCRLGIHHELLIRHLTRVWFAITWVIVIAAFESFPFDSGFDAGWWKTLHLLLEFSLTDRKLKIDEQTRWKKSSGTKLIIANIWQLKRRLRVSSSMPAGIDCARLINYGTVIDSQRNLGKQQEQKTRWKNFVHWMIYWNSSVRYFSGILP